MNLNQKITFSETVFAQEVDGEMVLLDMESELVEVVERFRGDNDNIVFLTIF